jgi:ferritin-like metal-binding protein YciE
MISSNHNDENNKFIDHLNEVLSAENAAIERLEKRIQETPIQDSKKILQQHLQEEKEQQKRLEDLISTYGKKPTDSKAEIISLHTLTNETRDKIKKDNIDDTHTTKISTTTIHDNNNINNNVMTSEESEILNTKEDALIKNDEISSYKTILKIAEGAMGKDVINILKQNLQEKV